MLLQTDSTKRDKKRKVFKILAGAILIFFLSSSFLFISPQPARADMPVVDLLGNAISSGKTIWDKIQNVLKVLWTKVAAVALEQAVSNTLKTIAYDEATYLGSGREGQKPLWETGNTETIMSNIGDNAAGAFISSIDKQFGVKLCNPDLNVKLSIGLGLVGATRPPAPDCTGQQMIKNWQTAIDKFTSVNSQDFLKQFASVFDLTGNDVGASLSAQSDLYNQEWWAQLNKAIAMQAGSQGLMNDKRNIAGTIEGTPGEAQKAFDASIQTQNAALLQTTKDDLVDLAMVFVKQLSITGLQTIMKKLTTSLNQPAADVSITNPYAAPQSGGIAAAQGVLRKIIEPQFNSKADYSILQQLSVCNVGVIGGVGPTDCVIDDVFSQQIADRKTVGEAFNNDSKPFGFIAASSNNSTAIEPSYTEGYPYRSMPILRKYRIIPVGWELAAQYIEVHPDVISGNHNNLKDLIACYDPNDSYKGYNDDGSQKWCEGLIDPSWVLKAPQNYCSKMGYGPQILSGQSVSGGVDANGKALQSQFQVVRADSYCGDEQSCIKEKDDGSCKYFGYCTEDKRLWKFGDSGSCDAQFNTCQTFTDSQGKQISYLKDSLQFCTADQAGCHEYAIATPEGYNSNTSKLDWTKSSDSIFLNKNAKPCDQGTEGCHEFLRFTSGLGTNLIINSDFSADIVGNPPAHWAANGSAIVSGQAPAGRINNVVEVTSNSSLADLYSQDWSTNVSVSAFPQGFVMEPEVSYTFSADVYLKTGDSVSLAIGRDNSTWQPESKTTTPGWQTLSVTLLNNETISANKIRIEGSGANIDFFVSNIKFEVGKTRTAYSAYRDNNLIYEKFMPAYLRDACYIDPANGDYRLLAGAPDVCRTFARQCNKDEVDCDNYTNINDPSQVAIPAAVTEVDTCPTECVGYNTYIQSEDNFSSTHVKYFIPSTAKVCSASDQGCEEFTNLASSTSGGERKEYYSYLRQCVKPADAGVSCDDFYTWEGSATAGQQLVKYNLKSVSAAKGVVPDTTSDDSSLCNAIVYGLKSINPLYSADCRQFYDKAGNISYHLYSKTITCTADCHTYRLTRNNVVDGINAAACTTAGVLNLLGAVDPLALHADSTQNNCVYCKDGGKWDGGQGGCIYQAYVPESSVCAAADNGCAEYNGNGGANTQTVMNDDFEASGIAGNDNWSAGSVNGTAYIAGSHSYQFSGSINKIIGAATISQGSSYVLTFWAKADNNDSELSAKINNGTADLPFDKSVTVKSGIWRIYSLNLPAASQTITDNETLVITSSGANPIYIDNIQLTRISDRYYLVEDSWKTPDSCNRDAYGNPYPYYALGCSAYNNHLGDTKYLHSFDHICQPTAVGCEAIIDTQNSDSADADSSYGATTTVAADRVIYAVYDENKLCDKSVQGCERLGQKTSYGAQATYADAYLTNNPNLYGSILCGQGGVGCNLFAYTSGASAQAYFKDPGNQVCEWRQSPTVASNNGWGWFKKKVTRCNGTDEVCATNKDCSSGSCVTETADTPCPVEKLKTIGAGGLGNEVYQPGSDGAYQWAGLCPDVQSGCTEYIDPVSDFSGNVVYNSDFSQHISNPEKADSWSNTSPPTQNINLEGGTLYVFAVQGNNIASLDNRVVNGKTGAKTFHVLKSDNTFADPTDIITVNANQSILFYTDNTIKEISVTNNNSRTGTTPNLSKIILRKAVVAYHLAEGDGGVDKGSCTQGGANPSAGCVYFNERAMSGGSLSSLDKNLDPWASYGVTGINPTVPIGLANSADGGIDLANSLIKVNPDRDCAQWLACKSYVYDENSKSNICFDIANCNRLDDAGNCANFTVLNKDQQGNRIYDPTAADPTAENPDTIKNLTGYTRVGYPTVMPLSDLRIIPNDLLNFGIISQVGRSIIVPNGDFELAVSTSSPVNSGAKWIGNPSGWTPVGGSRWTKDTAESLFSVVSDPETAQVYGFYTDRKKSANVYPMVGKSFLRYNATTLADGTSDNFPKSGLIYVQPGQDYYLSFYVNTFSLKGGTAAEPASAKISVLNSAGVAVASVTQGNENGWALLTQKFTVPQNSNGTIRLLLGATALSSGNIFIDDLQITPVLVVRKASDYMDPSLNSSADIPNLYDRQTCRLYPQEDSLSCSYYDNAGILQKGDPGYCLQYDRAPGDPNACILWWPIDKVKGSGIQTGQAKGYDGRAPLYYCIAANFPYIDTSEVHYSVDENVRVYVNNLNSPIADGVVPDINSSVSPITKDWVGVACNKNGGRECQRGVLSDHLNTGVQKYIPLQYGTNTIEVDFQANTTGGFTFLSIYGKIRYMGIDLTPVAKNFNFVDMYNEFAAKGFDVPDFRVIELANGGKFQTQHSCGDKAHDKQIVTRNCNINGTYVADWGDGGLQSYITNSNNLSTPPSVVPPGVPIDAVPCSGDTLCNGTSGSQNWIKMFYSFYIPEPVGCFKIAQVVDSEGRNKAWVERVRDSLLTCNKDMPGSYVAMVPDQTSVADPKPLIAKVYSINPAPGMACTLSTITAPFGSVNPPFGDGTLSFWSNPDHWQNVLPYWSPTADDAKTNGSMGQLYTQTEISTIFSQSYGVWNWDTTTGAYKEAPDTENWSAPNNICKDGTKINVRPVCTGDGTNCNCGIAPLVSNINLNGARDAFILGRGFVNLTFNSQVDPEQVPLTSYSIDWGDGPTSTLEVSGSDMNTRPPGTSPHSAYYAYDYYDLLNKYNQTQQSGSDAYKDFPTLKCVTGNSSNGGRDYCTVIPRVKIVDNWGWCSEGGIIVAGAGQPCPVISDNGGHCMNPSTRASSGTCWANSGCTNAAYPICADGWWEASGKVTVYKQY